jgi:hypothetical protein
MWNVNSFSFWSFSFKSFLLSRKFHHSLSLPSPIIVIITHQWKRKQIHRAPLSVQALLHTPLCSFCFPSACSLFEHFILFYFILSCYFFLNYICLVVVNRGALGAPINIPFMIFPPCYFTNLYFVFFIFILWRVYLSLNNKMSIEQCLNFKKLHCYSNENFKN